VAQPHPWGAWFLTNLLLDYIISFHVNFSFQGPLVAKKRRFLKYHPIKTHAKTVSPIVAPSNPQKPWFLQSCFCTISEHFRVNFRSFGPVDLEKKILKIVFLCNHMWKQPPLLWPQPTPKGHDFDKKIFKWSHPIFTFLWLSPLWGGPGPLFEQTWIPLNKV
jgi:hypothetical protein